MTPRKRKKSRVNTVTLVRCGNSVSFSPVIEEVAASFQTVWHTPRFDGNALAMGRTPVNLLTCDGDQMRCLAGLTDLVIEQLTRLSYQVNDHGRTSNSRLRRLGAPQPFNQPNQPSPDGAFLQFVSSHERGLVNYDPGRISLAWLIMQAALAWPNRRIVCPVTRIQDAHSVAQELRKELKETILVATHRRCPGISPRIVIGPYGSLGGGEASLHARDFVFAIDPLEMLTDTYGQYVIRDADRSRIFGFMPFGQRMTVWQRDQSLAVFGPNRLTIPFHGHIQRRVHAVFLTFEAGFEPKNDGSLSDILRSNVWRHRRRNREVARLAAAIASGSDEKILNEVGRHDIWQLLQQCATNPLVAVLVANLEQAVPICRRLPGWPLVTGETMRTLGLNEGDARLLLEAAGLPPGHQGTGVVVTQAGLPYLGACDVLVRADAGTGPIAADWADSSQLCLMSPSPAILIDFRDRHHPELRLRSRRRRQAYLEAGWRLPLDYPHELDQFLAIRPKEMVTSCPMSR